MIEFSINKANGHELALVRIKNMTGVVSEVADYTVQIALDTASGVAVYQRSIYGFPRKDLNILGLVKAALDSLTEEELSLDTDPDSTNTSNLARGLNSALRAF